MRNKIYYNDLLILKREKKGNLACFELENGEIINGKHLYGNPIKIKCIKCSSLKDVKFYNALEKRDYICVSCNQSGEKNSFYGKRHSEESKDKVSKANKGKLVGEKNPFYGKKHSEEVLRKLSEINKGKQVGEKNPFYGKAHSEETKKILSEKTSQYFKNLSFQEQEHVRKQLSKGQKKFQEKNPEYYKFIKRKAGLASSLNHEKYKMNLIEKKVNEEFLRRGLIFKYSVIFCHKQFDFGNKENRILLEVQGDYWHGNPLKYKCEMLNETQKRNIENDHIKKAIAEKHNYKLFYIWECDINVSDFSVLDEIEKIYEI